jgi:hypothetical protein
MLKLHQSNCSCELQPRTNRDVPSEGSEMTNSKVGQVCKIAAGLLLGGGVYFSSYAQANYDTVYIKAMQVCLQLASRSSSCLPPDGRAKNLPVWSHDGRRIAYIEADGQPSALAKLVVIDRRGTRLAQVPLKTVSAGEVRSGMRQVESLEWISESLVVASGSINPTSFESIVIDTTRQLVTSEVVTDAFPATFSADGLSYVALTGQPHFGVRDLKRLIVVLDGNIVPNLIPPQTEVAGAPSWAPDGTAFTVPLRYVPATSSAIDIALVWVRNSNEKRSINLPPNTMRLEWGSVGLVAVTSSSGLQSTATTAWELPITTKPFQLSAWRMAAGSAVDLKAKVRSQLAELRSSLRLENGVNIDVWCSSCELSAARRIVPKD